MQLNAITRKSAVMAIILLVVIITAAMLRYSFAPFNMELADSAAHDNVWLLILAVALYIGNAILQGKTLSRAGLCSGQCTLPIPIFGLLACGIFVAPNMVAASVASLCLAVALHLLLRSLQNLEETDSVFFSSILLGTAALFYPPCIVLFAVVPVSVVALALSLRQAMLMLVGYVTPILAASYIVWYRGGGFLDVANKFFSELSSPQMSAIGEVPYLAISIAALVLILLVWGVIHSAVRPIKIFMLMRVRRALYFYVFIALASLTMIFLPSCDLSALAVVAVPLTILLSCILDILPNTLSTLAYWTLLILFFVHLFVA